MKRILTVLAVLFLAASLGAQVLSVPQSILGEVTSGIFLNELDAAANIDEGRPGPDFSTLGGLFLFGGLDNLNQYLADSTTAILPWVGVYLPGSIPMSIFDRLSFTNAGVEDSVAVTENTSTKTVAESGVDHDYIWVNRNRTWTYKPRAFAGIDETIRANFALGALNLGAGFRAIATNGSTAATNYTLVDTRYFDSAAAGIAPAPQTNFTVTSTLETLNNTADYDLELDAFMKTGDLWHSVVLSMGLGADDYSGASSTTQSAPPADPASGAGNYTNTTSDTLSTAGDFGIFARYQASLPGKGGDPDGRTYFGLSASADFNSAKYSDSSTSANFTYVAGGGATPVAGVIGQSTLTRETGATTDFAASAWLGQYIYYNPSSNLRLGLKPNASVGFARVGNGYATIPSATTVTYVDGDADGSYDDAADTITTLAGTFTGFVITNPSTNTTGALVTDDTLSVYASLPVGAVLTLGKLPFQFIMGANPGLGWSLIKSSTSATTSTVLATIRDGTGATVGTDTRVDDRDPGSSTVQNIWSPTITYGLGLHADLGEKVSLDFQLNSTTLLDFDDISFQLIFSLSPSSAPAEE